ncbi:MAG: hypothetical protein H0T46_24185 [Deltaproteobacteria bacterium]|nr:hypothetical protein [Deltaproteobacteria bacterium]
MPEQRIQYRGRYQYTDGKMLERALASARAALDDDEIEGTEAWLRFFVRYGTSLTVNVEMPATSAHRFVAANLFLALANGAVEGSVEAVAASGMVDWFVAAGEA